MGIEVDETKLKKEVKRALISGVPKPGTDAAILVPPMTPDMVILRLCPIYTRRTRVVMDSNKAYVGVVNATGEQLLQLRSSISDVFKSAEKGMTRQ